MKRDSETRKKYLEANKEKIALQKKENYEKNKQKRLEYQKNWNQENREKLREYQKNRILNDGLYRLKTSTKNRIGNYFRSCGFQKMSRTEQILGCSYEEFKTYIESKFEDWMTWDNYGSPRDKIVEPNKTWDIDHIIPMSTATCEADIIKLNHYTNLQPLCSYTNRFIKRDSLDFDK